MENWARPLLYRVKGKGGGEVCRRNHRLSEGVRRYFYTTYHRETHFIPNGVGKLAIREVKEITKKFGLHKEEYILFLGRIVPEKGSFTWRMLLSR